MNLFLDYQKKILTSLKKLEKEKLIKIPLQFKKFGSIPYVSKIINKHVNNIRNFRKEIIINHIARDLINLMVIDVIKTTNENLKKNKPQTINDIYKQNSLTVNFSKKMRNIDHDIKDFLKSNMYNHKKV